MTFAILRKYSDDVRDRIQDGDIIITIIIFICFLHFPARHLADGVCTSSSSLHKNTSPNLFIRLYIYIVIFDTCNIYRRFTSSFAYLYTFVIQEIMKGSQVCRTLSENKWEEKCVYQRYVRIQFCCRFSFVSRYFPET